MMLANAGLNNLKILIPMISTLPEIDEAISLIKQAHTELVEESIDTSLPAIDMAIKSAKKNKIPIGVCGEMASYPMVAVILMGMGIDSLSMSATSMLLINSMLFSKCFGSSRPGRISQSG